MKTKLSDECTKEELEEVQRQLAETCNDPNLTIVGGPHLTFEDLERIMKEEKKK
jgi:predicted aconitase